MRRLFPHIGILVLAATSFAENTAPLPAAPAAAGTAFITICPVEDEIGDGTAVVVERAVRESEGAAAIIFVINTPGGRVDSAIDITEAIMSAPCPTIAYIEKMGAISAGALISFACDQLLMAPTANIGAATPFVPGMEPNEDLDEKSRSFVRAKFRALAEANGHDPLLGEAMVDRDVELYGYRDDGGKFVVQKSDRATASGDEKQEAAVSPPPDLPTGARQISPRGELLTLTAQEALEYGLITAKAASLDDVIRQLGWGELRRYEVVPTWSEGLFGFLTSPLISSLLLMCGLGGLYFEMRTPGFGLPGIIGLCCLALFFGAQYIVGLANWLDVMLVVSGVFLLAIEVFVLPGFGAAGIAGIACIVAGLYLSLTRVVMPRYTWEYERLNDAVTTLALSSVAFVVFAVVLGYLLPKTRMFNRLVLAEAQQTAVGYTVQRPDEGRAFVGMRGVAESMLRPAGRGRFGSRTLDVVTRGEFIEKHRPIVIIEAEGNRLVVTETVEDTQ